MASRLSVRFATKAEVTCPVVRNHLAMRVEANDRYSFDQSRVRVLIAQIVDRNAGHVPAREVGLVEVYTGNRHCAALEWSNSVILDYGFIELLSDNIGLEYLDYSTERELRARLAAGNPDDWPDEDRSDRFVVGGVTHYITGTMVMRDLACKFLEDIVPEARQRDRLTIKLLWRAADRGRPNFPYHLFLTDSYTPRNVMPAFVADEHAQATLVDQTALATAFLICHEISHLVFTDGDQLAWRESRLVQAVMALFEQLCSFSIEDGDEPYPLRELTAAARTDPAVYERLLREALIDIRAIDMLIENERGEMPKLERWSTFFANLFGLVSMTNSLGIFRSHLDASIRNRSMGMTDIRLARSEAVTRNLIVLAYLLHRNQKLAGKKLAEDLIPKIHLEWLVLKRRMLYFYLDLTAAVSEDDWTEFIDSALA